MKLYDLMLGDNVYVTNTSGKEPVRKMGKVKEIYETSAYVYCGETYGSIYVNRYKESQIDPIPLTPEMLQKNGFVITQEYEEFFCAMLNYDLALFYDSTETPFSFSWQNHGEVEIRYVHELQHLMRFCGLSDVANNFKV